MAMATEVGHHHAFRALMRRNGTASITELARDRSICYNTAARVVREMTAAGVASAVPAAPGPQPRGRPTARFTCAGSDEAMEAAFGKPPAQGVRSSQSSVWSLAQALGAT